MKKNLFNKFTLLFQDKETELNFLQKSLKAQKTQIMFLLFAMSILSIINIYYSVHYDKQMPFLFIYFAVFLGGLIFQIIYPFEKKNQFKQKELFLLITCISSLLFSIYEYQTSENVVMALLAGVVILQLSAILFLFGIRFFYSIIAGFIFVVFSETLAFLENTQSLLSHRLIIYFSLLVYQVAIYFSEKQKRENYQVNILLKKSNKKLQKFFIEFSKDEETTKLVLDKFPGMIISLSPEGEILFWNKECQRLTGYNIDEVKKKEGCLKLLYGKNIESKTFELFTKDKLHLDFETKITDKFGKKHIIRWKKITLYKYLAEVPEWYVGTDVTEEVEVWKNLKKRENELISTQNIALIGNWEWDIVANKLSISNQMYKLYNLNKNKTNQNEIELISQNLTKESIQTIEEDVRKAVENKKQAFAGEYTMVFKTGKCSIMYIQGQIIYNQKQEATKIYGTSQDISASKSAECKIKSIQQSLEHAQQIAKLGNIEYKVAKNKVYISKEVFRILEITNLKTFMFPEDLANSFNSEDYKTIYGFLKKEKNLTTEMTIKTPDGTNKILTVMGKTYYDEYNQVIKYLILQDNTALSKAIKELKKNKLRITNILTSLPDPIMLIDKEFNIKDVNTSVEKTFNREYEELLSLSLSQLFDKQEFKIFVRKAERLNNENNVLNNLQLQMKRKQGEKFPADISIVFMPNENKEIREYIIVTKDVTLQKKYEKRLKEARMQAEEADKLKSSFLANMSHEIRTPMNAIIGFSQMLIQADISQEEKEEYAGYISSNSNSLLTMIDDIIDISKIEAGQLKIKYKNVSIETICEHVLIIANEQKKIYKKHDLDIISTCEDKLYKSTVRMDKVRVIQVFTNLVTNAVKFTDIGFVKCSCEITKIDNKKYLKFSIQDTGVGIKYENADKIFSQFYRTENKGPIEYRGTGLGLALSKKLLTLMNGKIEVNSEEGKGSTFSFYIPYMPVERSYDKKINNNLVKKYDWKDKKIIIAEDDLGNYKFFELLLAPTNVEILHATDGQTAIALFQSEPNIDLVIMDIKLPEMDGYQATEKLKSMKKDLPIIAVTAFAMSDEKQKIMNFQFDDYLPKPVKNKKLLSVIDHFLSN